MDTHEIKRGEHCSPHHFAALSFASGGRLGRPVLPVAVTGRVVPVGPVVPPRDGNPVLRGVDGREHGRSRERSLHCGTASTQHSHGKVPPADISVGT